MLVRIYKSGCVSLTINLTCYGELEDCGLRDILNKDFLLICSENNGLLKPESCIAKLPIKFLIQANFKGKLIRRVDKEILEEILSDSIKLNNWSLMSRSNIYNTTPLNQTQKPIEIINHYPNDLNLIELFKKNIVKTDNDYSILCGIYKVFKKIKVE